MSVTDLSSETVEGLVFVGQALGPLFLHDPALDRDVVEPLYRSFAQADPAELAAEWPFVDAAKIEPALARMVVGLKAGEAEAADDAAALQDSTAHDDLVWEYRRLFVGPAKKAAPPWGSVYTDKDQVVFGQSALDLREWLWDNGIALTQGESDEPEDHIGIMLELLAYMAANRPELVRPYLQQHFLTWAPHFLELMEAATERAFFQGLAQTTRLTLLGIQRELDLQVDIPRFYR